MPNTHIEHIDEVLESRTNIGQLDTMYRKAWVSSDRQMKLAQAIMTEFGDENGVVDDDDLYKKYRSHIDSSLYFQRQADGIKALAEKHLDTHASLTKVKSEPRTYSPLRPEVSYFEDLVSIAVGPTVRGYEQAQTRMQRYSRELDVEVRNASAEGRYATRCVRENFRTTDQATGSAAQVTQRSVSSASGSFGSVVTPLYLTQDTAGYRTPVSAFLDESNAQDMPDYGLEVYVPQWNTGTSVAAQGTENTGIDSSVPTADLLSNSLTTMAGTIPVSQQLQDRAGPSGFDAYAIAQLRLQLDTAVDAYVIVQAIAVGESVTDATALTVTRLYTDLSTARENMSNAAGVSLKASHVFATSNFNEWLFKQVDDQHRPVIVPDPSTLIALPPTGEPTVDSTFTGVFLNRQGLWEDDNIPAQTSHPTYAQVLVADMSKVFTWRSAAVPRVIVGQGAADLSVDIQLYQYVSAIIQFPDAVQIISGAGLANLS